MGQYQRTDFSAGWVASADAFNAPKNALLRMDNLILDELGTLALRQGSQKINTTVFTRYYSAFDYTAAFETTYFIPQSGIAQFTQEWERPYLTPTVTGNGPADHNFSWEVSNGYVSTTTISTDTDVHSLFTGSLNGTRMRMSGVTDAVYANGSAIWGSLAGSGDTSFGAHMGHLLFARSTTKRKYNGTAVYPWGVTAPTGAPTVTGITATTSTLSTCAAAEAPGFTTNEGTQTFVNDRAGNANAAVQLAPDTTTGRAVSTKTFAAPTDFSGPDDDLIDFYVRVAEPQYVTSVTVMVDFNGGLFQEDYVERTFTMGEATEVLPDIEDSLASTYTVEGEDRDRVIGQIEDREPNVVTQFRQDVPAGNTGWNHFSVPRGAMNRSGLTSGKNWSTVEAVRVIVNAIAGGSGAAVRFDDLNIIGGTTSPLTGKYKAAIVAVRNDGTYNALSGPSAFSSEIEVKAQGIRATLSATVVNSLDAHVNELWLYLMGGHLNAFYLFTKKTGGPFGGAITIDATTSEITALSANIRMETENGAPPDSIIGIEGPHFDRTLCLTSQFIYPSRQRNPDSFSSGEVVRIGDAAETGLWIKKLGRAGLYVGTTRDVYELSGDWTVLPDGSINVLKVPMHVSEPPVSSTVEVGTINGVETLIYLAGDGWRALGAGSLVSNAVDLLWRGFTRHGVSYVNIADSAARFRCGVAKNILFAITPEGTSTTSSATIHAYHFGKQRWYRFTYPQAFRSIHAEPDGTLIAGDASGFVRVLDLATKQDDGVDIPIVFRMPVDDNGQPFTYKNAENFWMRLDTGGDAASIAFHLNGSDTADSSTTTSQNTTDTANQNVSTMSEFGQLQLRISGSFSTFILRGWGLRYLDLPIPQVIHDSGFVDLSEEDENKWVRALRIKAKSAVDLTVTPYWDGTAGTVSTISALSMTGVSIIEIPLGRQDRARVGRVVITSSDPSHVFWIKFLFRGTGRPLEKTISLVPEVA